MFCEIGFVISMNRMKQDANLHVHVIEYFP